MSEKYEITKNDCDNILRQHLRSNNFELIEFEEKTVSGEVVGIMAGHYNLKTKARLDEENIVNNNFFVKRMQAPYKMQTRWMKQQKAYGKENFAYGNLRKLYEQEPGYICDFMANCYLSIKDQLFVFQDITEDGYTVKSEFDVLDMKHLKLVLDMTAKFHAGSIIYEHKKSLETGKECRMLDLFSQFLEEPNYRRSDDFVGNMFYKTCVKAVLSLIDVVPYYKDNKNEIKNKFLSNVDKVYDLVKPSNKFFNVLCHGDLWNSNLMFKYDKNNEPVHCKLLDFQALRYTVPVHDYLYIVVQNNFDNDKNPEELNRHYYESLENYLRQSGIDINKYITYNDFLESVNYIYPFVIVQNACFANLCIARLKEDILKNEDLFDKCMYGDRSEWCIEAYKNNELFRNIVDPSMKDLRKL